MKMEDLDTTYTVIIYWEDGPRHSSFQQVECVSAQEATETSIQAQVDGADTVWIFKGGDVSEEIANWKEVSDRIEAGRKQRANEERARHQREINEAIAHQKATQEKYERIQLKKLLDKYGPEGVDVP